MDQRLTTLVHTCGTGGGGGGVRGVGGGASRDACVDTIGTLRTISRLESSRRTVCNSRRFQHALHKYMLEDEEIQLIAPMVRKGSAVLEEEQEE